MNQPQNHYQSRNQTVAQAQVYRARTAFMLFALSFAIFCLFAQISRLVVD